MSCTRDCGRTSTPSRPARSAGGAACSTRSARRGGGCGRCWRCSPAAHVMFPVWERAVPFTVENRAVTAPTGRRRWRQSACSSSAAAGGHGRRDRCLGRGARSTGWAARPHGGPLRGDRARGRAAAPVDRGLARLGGRRVRIPRPFAPVVVLTERWDDTAKSSCIHHRGRAAHRQGLPVSRAVPLRDRRRGEQSRERAHRDRRGVRFRRPVPGAALPAPPARRSCSSGERARRALGRRRRARAARRRRRPRDQPRRKERELPLQRREPRRDLPVATDDHAERCGRRSPRATHRRRSGSTLQRRRSTGTPRTGR